MPALVVVEGPTIAAGQAESDAVDCTGGLMVRLTMPYTWSDAPITFMASSDGVYFNNLMNIDGTEVTCQVVANTTVFLSSAWAQSVAHLKIRSGTAAAPVNQSEQRTFAVALLPSEGAAPVKQDKWLNLVEVVQVQPGTVIDGTRLSALLDQRGAEGWEPYDAAVNGDGDLAAVFLKRPPSSP